MKTTILALTALAALAFIPGPGPAAAASDDFRVWKNTAGTAIEARLIEKKAGSVILELRSAKRYEVPIANLSAEDISWMNDQETAAAEAETADSGIAFETLMAMPGKIIFEDDLSEVREGWGAGNGEWTIQEGALLGKELAADNHGATFKRSLALKDAVIQYSFKLDGATGTTLSLDNGTGHLCRVSINASGFTAQKDDNDKDTGPDEAIRFGTAEMDLASNKWHTLVIELLGDTFLAQVDGEEVSFGSHEKIAGEKTKLGFTIAGESVHFKNLKVWEALPEPVEDWEKVRRRLERRMK